MTTNFVMLHALRHGSADFTVLKQLMQDKNTSHIKLNVKRSRKMSRSRPINVSASSRTPNWTSRARSRSREKW